MTLVRRQALEQINKVEKEILKSNKKLDMSSPIEKNISNVLLIHDPFDSNRKGKRKINTIEDFISFSNEHSNNFKMITNFNLFENNESEDEKLIMKAIDTNNKTLFIDIVNKISDINYVSSSEKISLLHWSIYKWDYEIVELLLKKGANPNIKDYRGLTPLMWAFDDSSLEVIYLLTNYGSDWNITDNNGDNFIEFSKKYETRFDINDKSDFEEKLNIITDKDYTNLMYK